MPIFTGFVAVLLPYNCQRWDIIMQMETSFKNQNLKGAFIMQLPKVLEVKGVRVLTSQQLAEMYGTSKSLGNLTVE